MAQAHPLPDAAEAHVGRFLAQVFLVMTLGLAVTALTAGWVVSDLQRLLRISGEPWLVWGLFIIQMIIVAVLSAAVTRLSGALAAVLFLLYAALTGVTISLIVLMYTQEDITAVFWIAAGTFLLSGGVGLVLKRDLSAAGGLLTMLLLGWLLAWCVSIFFPRSHINWLLSMVGVALFVGLTAWDMQRLKQMAVQLGDRAPGAFVINGALALYLDFINLFLLLLRASSR
jgi:FtsH-binding integral membrane protein